MSGFYYQTRLVDLQLSDAQVLKIRNYLRDKVRSVAAVDSGEFLRSISTRWDKGSQVLTIYSTLYYSGYIEGGNVNYMHHKSKIHTALVSMGLNPTEIAYF